MKSRLILLGIVLASAAAIALPASASAGGSDLSASLTNGNFGGGSGQFLFSWTNVGTGEFSGTINMTITAPSSVDLTGAIYEAVCSPEQPTGCATITINPVSAGELTVVWTGTVAPGKAYPLKVLYTAAGMIGTLGPGQIVATMNDTDPTDTDTADKSATLSVGSTTPPPPPTLTAQTIHFTSTPPSNATVGGSYQVSATASSGLAVTFVIDPSSTAGACSIRKTTVSFNGAGECLIDAEQAGNSSYAPAPQVSQTVAITAPSRHHG